MDERIERGFALLTNGEFSRAQTVFSEVIENDPECGRAYFGRMMAYIQVKDASGFAKLSRGITESPDYAMVMRYGDAQLREELNAAALAASTNAAEIRYLRACQIMEQAKSENEYNDAAYWFGAALKYIPDYRDAKEKQQICVRKGQALLAENEDELVLVGEAPKEQSQTENDRYQEFAKRAGIAEEKPVRKEKMQKPLIRRAKPAEKKPVEQKPAEQNQEDAMIRQVPGDISDAELQKAKDRCRAKQLKKKKNAKVIAVLLGAVIVILGPILFIKVALPSMQLNSAKEMMERGDEARALKLFQKLDKLDVYAEILEEQALEKMENGYFSDALPLLLEAVDYDASVQVTLDSCLYRLAKAEFAEGDLSKAWDYYMRISTYDSSDEIYLVCSYELGKSALAAADFAGYKRAVDLLENCEHHYEDAKALKLEAMYGYLSEYARRDDPVSEEYLEVLQAEGYEGLEAIENAMYPWRVEVVAINPMKDDHENSMQSISVGRAVYFHFLLHGAPDAQPLTLYANYRLPSGQTGSYEFAVDWEDGMYGWYGWKDGVDSAGTLTVEFADQNGNILGQGSMKITD